MSQLQIALPAELKMEQVYIEPSLGDAIKLCAKVAGFTLDKELRLALNESGVKVDNAQLSRWESGSEGIVWEKFSALMDVCGNDAPWLWMIHRRGYDLESLRKKETELQRENRELKERLKAMYQVMKSA
jgi:hypothetical protein